MFKFVHFQVWMLLVLIISGCGDSSTSTHPPINTSSPLYISSLQNNTVQLHIINMSGYKLAGTIPLYTFNENGIITATGLGQPTLNSVIVSNPATYLNNQPAIPSSTRLCTLPQGTCTTLSRDEGSTSVLVRNNTIFVPFSKNDGSLHLAVFPNAAIEGKKIIDLPSGYAPGPLDISPDGTSIFWASRKLSTSPPSSVLLQYNLASGSIKKQYDLGTNDVSSLKVAPNGSVYISLLYSSGDQQHPVPGSSVMVFSENLSLLKTLAVGNYPQNIAFNHDASVMAVVYDGRSDQKISIFETTSGKLINHYSDNIGGIKDIIFSRTNVFIVLFKRGDMITIGTFDGTGSAIQSYSFAGLGSGLAISG